MLFEVFELDEVAAAVVNGDALEKILPHLVVSIKDLWGTDDGLHPWVPKNEVLDIHVVVNEGFKLLIIDLTAAVCIYLRVSVLNVFCDSALQWCGEPG